MGQSGPWARLAAGESVGCQAPGGLGHVNGDLQGTPPQDPILALVAAQDLPSQSPTASGRLHEPPNSSDGAPPAPDLRHPRPGNSCKVSGLERGGGMAKCGLRVTRFRVTYSAGGMQIPELGPRPRESDALGWGQEFTFLVTSC